VNPYASRLGELDPLEVIAATLAKLRKLMDAICGERAEQPRAPGWWSALEIVCHLADCVVAFACVSASSRVSVMTQPACRATIPAEDVPWTAASAQSITIQLQLRFERPDSLVFNSVRILSRTNCARFFFAK
jgi:hypothetical protein